jgi:pyroglutamyl-peptidase
VKLLLTGFEPFAKSQVNPSEQVVRALSQEQVAGIELRTAILPVDRARGPETLLRAFEQTQPDAVLCLGEASRRMAISIERVAINLMDYRIQDNSGNQITDEPIVRDGPAAYFVTLPVRAMLNAVRAACVPAKLSLSAGAFLCNQVTYALLHHLAQNKLKIPAGFIHLPALPEQVIDREPAIPSMGLETMLTGIRAAIGAIKSPKEKNG